MTHPNHQTNGASLEDCHTNFFALTDLCGIKWRKLVAPESPPNTSPNTSPDPLADPVLLSFSRCLAADILCVWRRVGAQRRPPPPSDDLLDPLGLDDTGGGGGGAGGGGQQGGGGPNVPPLALHASKELWIFWYGEEPDLSSLVAKELLHAEGDQGNWESGLSYECRSLLFKALHNLIERCLLSRDFVRLGKWFVQPYEGVEQVEGKSSHLSFLFSFFVHGESTVCASVDVRQHPPVRSLTAQYLQQAQAAQAGCPVILAPFGLAGTLTGQWYRAVDVQTSRLLEEWKHFYPIESKITSRDEPSLPPAVEVIVGGVRMRYPSCYVLATDMDDPNLGQGNARGAKAAGLPGAASESGPPSYADAACIRQSSGMKPPPQEPVPRVNLAEQVWQDSILVPPPEGSDGTHCDYADPTRKVPCTCSKALCPGGQSTPLPERSPQSAAPSPLPNPHSVPPTSVPPADPTMPTLSPQPSATAAALAITSTPPPPPGPGTPAHTPIDSHGPKSVSSISNQVFSPSPYQAVSVSSAEGGAGGPASAPPPGPPPVVPPPPDFQLLKRPVLSAKEYESLMMEDDAPSDLLYDYSVVDAWLDLPVKRSRLTDTESALPVTRPLGAASNNGGIPGPGDLYPESQPPLASPPVNGVGIGAAQGMFNQQDIKTEPGCDMRCDPYEFDEELGPASGPAMTGFKRNNNPAKEEDRADASAKSASGSLFTTEGLQPSYRDLEQIFSSDNSSDETMQVATPPGSNRADDGSGPRGPRCSVGILRPEELSKMFPTPPSLEHNPNSSPCGGQLSDGLTNDFTELPVTRFKQEAYPNMGSPQEETIEDWSYVFRPPVVFKMVGSSKYSPLSSLPSQNLPPIILPPNSTYVPSWQCPPPTDKSANNQHPNKHHMHSHHSGMSGKASGAPTPTPSSTHLQPHVQPHRPGLSPISPATHFPPSPHRPLGTPGTPGAVGTPGRATPGAAGGPGPGQCPPPSQPPQPAPPPPPPYSPALSSVSSYLQKAVCTAEASSLLMNILLAETALNIFRDHNFDSCTLCVCNAGPKVVGNIKGADASVYLAPYGPHPNNEDEPPRCSCGFSAVVNRRLSHRAGLFYEDELEITGIVEEPRVNSTHRALDPAALLAGPLPESENARPLDVLSLMREQCAVIVQSPASSLARAASQTQSAQSALGMTVNVLELGDGNEVSWVALEQGISVSGIRMPCVHRWPFLRAPGPQCSQDIVRIMKSLQPLLQEAVQKKCTTRLWEAPYTVKGPLTWREFHRLAGRGTEDRCEPQPVPAVLVGYDKDWLSLAPYALHLWENLLLEPYSYARDVAYIVLAPDNDFIVNQVKRFFKELSSVYEVCRLGRHCCISKGIPDGILRVGMSSNSKLNKEPIDDWFGLLGDSPVANMLRLYAQMCRNHLAPHLSQMTLDQSLLEPADNSVPQKPASSPMPPPSASDPAEKGPNTPKPEPAEGEGSARDPLTGSMPDTNHVDDEDGEPPAVVIYFVEPCTLGVDGSEVQRLACLGLLRCFSMMVNGLPEALRNNVSVQVISLESILEQSTKATAPSDYMRGLALSVYSQCRRVMQHSSNLKALTGFGPAATGDLFLKSKDEKNRAPYRLYSPPFVLAPHKEKSELGDAGEDCCVLYLSYCLSEDQRWLLAAATDERGAILDTTAINIHIPNRTRRKRASARRVGLQKLMDFILGVMSQSIRPWRLVVGRIGRIGHGELKGWSWLLSRKSLLKASKHLKEICGQCNLLHPGSVPIILSACLVSLEPDSALRLMPDQFTPDERFSQTSVNCQLSTPQDVTCTHILVFPTSATTQYPQMAFQEQHINNELGEDDLFNLEDMPDGMDDIQSFDIFGNEVWGAGGVHSPGASPRRDSPCGMNPGSPIPDANGSPFQSNTTSRGGEQQEEVGTVLQQPLALGYLVSTAPTGRMPSWFWSSCPHLENVCPCFLKNALHLHCTIQQSSDDLLHQQPQVSVHPLDSQYTTDVLRYVLEAYNALSWMGLDPATHDRLSCLPIHMQVLMQLYHTTSALV